MTKSDVAFAAFDVKTLTGLIEIYKADPDTVSNCRTQTDDPAYAACLHGKNGSPADSGRDGLDRTASLDAQKLLEALSCNSEQQPMESSVPLAPENIGASVVWADRAAQKLAVMSRYRAAHDALIRRISCRDTHHMVGGHVLPFSQQMRGGQAQRLGPAGERAGMAMAGFDDRQPGYGDGTGGSRGWRFAGSAEPRPTSGINSCREEGIEGLRDHNRVYNCCLWVRRQPGFERSRSLPTPELSAGRGGGVSLQSMPQRILREKVDIPSAAIETPIACCIGCQLSWLVPLTAPASG